MTRRLLAALFVTAVAFALTVRADDPPAKPADPKTADAPAIDTKAKQELDAANEKRLREDFENFKNEVLKLKQRLETSDKDEDKTTVRILENVLKEINNQSVDGKFDKVIERLQDPKSYDLIQKVTEVETGNKELHEAMQKLIDLLDAGDDFATKRKEREANQKLLEKLKEILSKQERLIAGIDQNRKSNQDLAKAQDKIKSDTKGTLETPKDVKPDFKKSEAKYDAKPGSDDKKGEAKNDTQGPKGEAKDNKEGDAKESKPGDDKGGEAKDGKPADGKEGDNKDGMKPSEGKPGDNKDGMKPGEGKPGDKGDKGAESKDGGKPSEGKDNKGADNKDAKPGEGKEANDKGGPGNNKESKAGESKAGDNKDGKPSEGKEGSKGDGKPSEAKDGKSGEGQDSKPGEGKEGTKNGANPGDKPGEGKEAGKPGADSKSGEGKPGESKEAGKPGDAKPGERKPGDGQGESKPGVGKGNEPKAGTGAEPGKPGDNKPGSGKEGGKPGDAKPGKPGEGKDSKPGDGKPGDAKSGESKEGKPGEGKPGEGKPSESKSGSDSKGQADGKGEAKPGDPKSGEDKPSESKSNPPSAGQPSQGQPSEAKGDPSSSGDSPPPQGNKPKVDQPTRKKIEDGEKDMEETKDKLNADDKPGALPPAAKAADDIQKAIKNLEEIINADRQEEIERILERLQARCARMLAMQIAVHDSTMKLDEKIKEVHTAKGDERPLALDSNVLSDREYEIVKEADRALALLENDGSAAAFAEMFQMVRKDMLTVKDRLGQTDTGTVTVAVEEQIIKNLSDMVDALKKQREANKQKGPKPPPGQQGPPKQPGEDPLVDMIAQLKLLRSMQKGLNDRTDLYSKEYQGEQAPAPDAAKDSKEKQHYEMIQKEMKELADTEAKISKVLKDMLTGKNRVD